MKAIRPIVIAAVLLAGPSACSSSSSDSSSDTDDGGGLADDGGLTTDEGVTFSSGGDSLAADQETVTLADSLFDFDPTIDPSATPNANAASIGANAQTNLGSSCGDVSISGASVTVNFGAAPGCTLADGAQISGMVSLGVTQSGTTTTIALTLASVVVNGEALSGQASFATTNGSTFTVTSTVTSGTKDTTAHLTVVGGASSFTISGTSDVTEGGSTFAVTFDDVMHVKGECYATSGSMTVVEGPTSEVITFGPSTPVTGVVSVQIGKRSTSSTLPAYGNCPSDAASDAGRGRD